MAGNTLDQWQIEYNSGIPVYRQIINHVCATVAAGSFKPGDQLFLTVVAGAHRHETKAALNDIIERVKYELDFKKEEHTDNGTNIIMSGG